ncbi:class II aldolase/adducin family protein [Ruania rhizosphaerae]|uniref:class II aldolase/adducin family protein n=1 Tax=Ruania rhizosphaerae TaxID=1840413 RepID=UPI001359D784|nr:class II aldolase/adducin family protein [Ruania rhizosphaerae]
MSPDSSTPAPRAGGRTPGASDAVGGPDALEQCIHASRRLGSDPYLVLYGGGNSSATSDGVVRVKASGHDMGTIGPGGFAPLRRQDVLDLLSAPTMSDADLLQRLRAALLDPAAPTPSIETPLHALLPQESVLHTHADAIVTLTNSEHAAENIRSALGKRVLVLPYLMPGFTLAQAIRELMEQTDLTAFEGIVLTHHGLITFGDDAASAYRRHLDLVERASAWITERTGIRFVDDEDETVLTTGDSARMDRLVGRLEDEIGGSFTAEAVRSPEIDAFLARADLAEVTGRGPSTLEHVIRTKRTPLLGEDVAGFAAQYTDYFQRNRDRSDEQLTMLDPAPRVVLDPSFGIAGVGRTPEQAQAARVIYRHTIRIIEAAERLGGYRTISEADAFDIEYWELEQAKLRN